MCRKSNMAAAWIISTLLWAQLATLTLGDAASTNLSRDKTSSVVKYFMTEILGNGRSTQPSQESFKEMQTSSSESTEQEGLFKDRNVTNMSMLTSQKEPEADWVVSNDVRSRRSQAYSAQWVHLSSSSEIDDDFLAMESLSEVFGHKALLRVERDIGCGHEQARLKMTGNWTIPDAKKAEFELLTGQSIEAYLEARPVFKGRSFNISEVTISGNTVEMSVTTLDLPDLMTQLGQVLYDLQDGNININKTTYYVTAIMLECLTTRLLKAVVCFLCALYQTCMQDVQTNKWLCKIVDDNFYPFGLSQGDSTLPPDIEDVAAHIYIETYIPFDEDLFENIWISVNGIISFKDMYTSFSPTSLPVLDDDDSNQRLLAPYWADLDLASSDSIANVFYQHYSSSASNGKNETAVFLKAETDVDMYSQEFSAFAATDVIVVTWESVPPWPANETTQERVTFQCVIISDGTVTYAMFLYGQGAMHFNPVLERPVAIGWGVSNLDNSILNYYTFYDVIGNKNISGHWFFKIGESSNSKKKCLQWYNQNHLLLSDINRRNREIPACPCSEIGAILSVFWIPSLEEFGCYEIFPLFGSYGRRCCYRQDRSFGFENRIPAAGGFQRYNFYAGDLLNHELEDILPKQWCCYETDLCDRFYTVRPTRNCTPRTTARSLFFGDPHVKGLDGVPFIFNGLGEFTLFEVNSLVPLVGKVVNFKLQGRTCLTNSSNIILTNATVFCALALKITSGATFMAEIGPSGKYLIIFVNGFDYSLQFQQSQTFNATHDGIYVQRVNDSLKVSTQDDIGLTITFHDRMIDFSIELDAKYKNFTRGLVGNFNDNPNDDFFFPNGSQVSNTSERNLFYYGWSWAVNDQSIFMYTNEYNTSHYSDPNSMPIFLDEADPSDIQEGQKICSNNDYACIYDYIATKNEAFATKTKETNVSFVDNEAVISNNPPDILSSLNVHVTVNQTLSLTLVGTDPDNDDFTFRFIEQPSSQYLQVDNQSKSLVSRVARSLSSNKDLSFNLTVTGVDPVYIAIVAVDSKGLESAVAKYSVIVCTKCNNRGLCNFTQLQKIISPYYSLASCQCQAPWSGDNCEFDKNGCAHRPCPLGTNCTDIAAKEENMTKIAYKCSDCPKGMSLSSNCTKCEDINECVHGSNPCVNAECINTYGSFLCNCTSGYRHSTRTTCTDINECTDSRHRCPQICVNTPGFYECECEEGFKKTGMMGFTCEKISDPCGNLPHNCSYGCHNASGVPACFCQTGLQVTSNGRSCEDIDECKENLCSQNCNNTYSSYKCSCYPGYIIGDDELSCVPCPKNTFGFECKQKCECRGHAERCDGVKGCICQKNWTGVYCESDVDECITRPNSCPPVQDCVNTVGSYRCVCSRGYRDTYNNGSCYNINECENPSVNKCPQKCVDNQGSFTCTCNAGFTSTSSSGTCQDINECTLGISGCQHICDNNNGSFVCRCRLGYILTDDRRSCIVAFEPCRDFNYTCSYACGLANDLPQCYCPLGFQLGTDNSSCIDINECTLNASICQDICTNTNGSYNCSCREGRQLLSDQRMCLDCDQNHWGPNCANLCNCYPKGVSHCDRFVGCVCRNGTSGTYCNEDVDECSLETPRCQNAHHCINTPGSYICTCNRGFQLDFSSFTCRDQDECNTTDPCDHLCTNTLGSYSCSCLKGFTSDGSKCMDIDECAVTGLNNCDQYCRNTEGGFACECSPGYELNTTTRNTCYIDLLTKPCIGTKNCSDLCVLENGQESCICLPGFFLDPTDNSTCQDINECLEETSPCVNSFCQNTVGNFNCSCSDGFRLANDLVTCQTCDFGFYGSNCSSICSCNVSNTEECLVTNGTCICDEGWMVPDCSLDVNECADSTVTICEENTTCINSPGSFRCVCGIGFFRTNGECVGCDSTHYGQDCLKNCNCVLENTMNCDDKTGVCLCNAGAKGTSCDLDIDECLNTTTCPGLHEFCHNLNFSYECLCGNGYERFDLAKECLDVNECLDPNLNTCVAPRICRNTNGSFECNCGEGYSDSNNQCVVELQMFTVHITLDYTYAQINPQIFDNTTSQFQDLARQVAAALFNNGRSIIDKALSSVKINNFINGSVVAVTAISIDTRFSNNPPGDMAKVLLSYLIFGNISIGNTTVNVTKITVQNVIVTSSSSLCNVFKLLTSCGTNEECQEVEGTPACQPVTKTNENLIIGLAVGISLFVGLVILVAIITYCCIKKKEPSNPPQSGNGSIFAENLAPRRSFSAAAQYKGFFTPPDYSDTESRAGGEYNNLLDLNNREQYDGPYREAVPELPQRDNESEIKPEFSYFWTHLSKVLEPHRNLQIQRPRVIISPIQVQFPDTDSSNSQPQSGHSNSQIHNYRSNNESNSDDSNSQPQREHSNNQQQSGYSTSQSVARHSRKRPDSQI